MKKAYNYAELGLPSFRIQKNHTKRRGTEYLVLMSNYTYLKDDQEICQASKIVGQVAHGQEFGPIEFRPEVLENYPQLKDITVYRQPGRMFVYTKNTPKADEAQQPVAANQAQAVHHEEPDEPQHLPEGDATELLLQIAQAEKLHQVLSYALKPRPAYVILRLASICLQCALEEPVGDGEAQLLKRLNEAGLDDESLVNFITRLDKNVRNELCYGLMQLLVQNNVEQGLAPSFNTFVLSDVASKIWREPWFRLHDEFSFHRNCVVDEHDSGSFHSEDELVDYIVHQRTFNLDITGYPPPPTTEPHAMFVAVDRQTGIPCYFHKILINGFYPDLPVHVNFALGDTNPGSVKFNYLHTLAGGALFGYFEEDKKLLTKKQIKEQAGFQIFDSDSIGISANEAARQLTELSCGFARSKQPKPTGTICRLATPLEFTQKALSYAKEQVLLTKFKVLPHDVTIMSWTWPESYCQKFTQELAQIAFAGASADDDGTKPATWYLHGFIDQARIGKTRTALITGLRDIINAHSLDQYQFLPQELRELDQKYHFYQDQALNMPAIEQAATDLNTIVLATTHKDLSSEQVWHYYQQRFALNQLYNGLVHCGLWRWDGEITKDGRHANLSAKMTLALLVMVLYQMLQQRINKALSGDCSELPMEALHYLRNVPEMLQLLNGKLPSKRLQKPAYQPKLYGAELLLRNSIFDFLGLKVQ